MIAKTLVVASLLFVCGVASAARQSVVAMQPVPTQIIQSAKEAGVWTGRKRELDLKYNETRTRVNVSVSTMSRFTGAPKPLPKAVRQVQATAKFRLQVTSEGTLATGVKQRGQVWQRILRASAPPASSR